MVLRARAKWLRNLKGIVSRTKEFMEFETETARGRGYTNEVSGLLDG